MRGVRWGSLPRRADNVGGGGSFGIAVGILIVVGTVVGIVVGIAVGRPVGTPVAGGFAPVLPEGGTAGTVPVVVGTVVVAVAVTGTVAVGAVAVGNAGAVGAAVVAVAVAPPRGGGASSLDELEQAAVAKTKPRPMARRGATGLDMRRRLTRAHVTRAVVRWYGMVPMPRAIVVEKAKSKPAAKKVTVAKPKPAASAAVAKLKPRAGAAKKAPATKDAAWTLPEAMTGRASPAKAADGDAPVFAYIRSLPQPQRGVAERVDALAAETLPNLKRAVKWGIAWYGVGDGWCFSCGGFATHVKLTFGRGTSLDPVPPSTPIGMGKDARGVDIVSLADFDEMRAADWMKQATALPGFGGKKR